MMNVFLLFVSLGGGHQHVCAFSPVMTPSPSCHAALSTKGGALGPVPLVCTAMSKSSEDDNHKKRKGLGGLLDDIGDKIEDKIEDVKEDFAEVIEDVKEDIEDVIEDVKEDISDKIEDVRDDIGEARHVAKERIAARRKRFRALVLSLLEGLEDNIEDLYALISKLISAFVKEQTDKLKEFIDTEGGLVSGIVKKALRSAINFTGLAKSVPKIIMNVFLIATTFIAFKQQNLYIIPATLVILRIISENMSSSLDNVLSVLLVALSSYYALQFPIVQQGVLRAKALLG